MDDYTTREKLVRIAVKSGITGLIGGVVVRVVFGEVKGKISMPIFGKATVPIAVGTTLGLAQATANIVDEFVLDSETKENLDKTLAGMFSLALSIGATLLIGWMLLPSSMMNMRGFLKLAGFGTITVVSTDWVYNTFLEGVVDDFSAAVAGPAEEEDEEEEEVPEE